MVASISDTNYHSRTEANEGHSLDSRDNKCPKKQVYVIDTSFVFYINMRRNIIYWSLEESISFTVNFNLIAFL